MSPGDGSANLVPVEPANTRALTHGAYSLLRLKPRAASSHPLCTRGPQSASRPPRANRATMGAAPS
jgi:hypothetical protein